LGAELRVKGSSLHLVPIVPLRAAKGRPARREKISVRVTARLRKKKGPDALTVEAEVLTQRGTYCNYTLRCRRK
jgi:hypothetical protein